MKPIQPDYSSFFIKPLTTSHLTTTTNYPITVISLYPSTMLLSDSLAKKQTAKELVFDRFKEVLGRLD